MIASDTAWIASAARPNCSTSIHCVVYVVLGSIQKHQPCRLHWYINTIDQPWLARLIISMQSAPGVARSISLCTTSQKAVHLLVHLTRRQFKHARQAQGWHARPRSNWLYPKCTHSVPITVLSSKSRPRQGTVINHITKAICYRGRTANHG